MSGPSSVAHPLVSLAVVARARIPELERLVTELLAIDGPAEREVIVGVETPGSQTVSESVDDRGVRWIALPPQRGVGYNRNRVLELVRGDIVASTDDDCVPKPGWLTALLAPFDDPTVHAAVGGVEIPPAGYVGDSISALGFPAGGNAGFATMFPVEADGTTSNITTVNCAIRVATLRGLGGFDETFSFGGEDTELAHRFDAAGKRIVFVPSAFVIHPARTSLAEFTRWFWVRGRAKAQFARKVPVSGYAGGRLASYGRILRANAQDSKIVLIVALLTLSVLLQLAGFAAEWLFPRR